MKHYSNLITILLLISFVYLHGCANEKKPSSRTPDDKLNEPQPTSQSSDSEDNGRDPTDTDSPVTKLQEFLATELEKNLRIKMFKFMI